MFPAPSEPIRNSTHGPFISFLVFFGVIGFAFGGMENQVAVFLKDDERYHDIITLKRSSRLKRAFWTALH